MTATAIGWRGKARGNKYGARKTVVDGLKFDSAAEAKRWEHLKILQRLGEIELLRRQCQFPLYVGDWLIGLYVADFVYFRAGKRVVEDVKGKATELFRWKALHFAAQYGQPIEVVR
jgi:hypothetical protein